MSFITLPKSLLPSLSCRETELWKKFSYLGFGVVSLQVILTLITNETQLVRCRSESLSNIRTLLLKKGAGVTYGDVVCLENHKISYGENDLRLVKRILGLPGDFLYREKGSLKIIPQGNTHPPQSLPLLKCTSKGEPLMPLSERTISKGFVFVAGDHPQSFDSRYEEFGLVPIERITGKALITW